MSWNKDDIPPVGIEPTTTRSRVVRSTTELRRLGCLEGFEPPSMSSGGTSATTAPQTLNIIRQACFYLLPRLEHTSCRELNPAFFNCKSKVILLLNPVLEYPLFYVLEKGQLIYLIYLFIQFFILLIIYNFSTLHYLFTLNTNNERLIPCSSCPPQYHSQKKKEKKRFSSLRYLLRGLNPRP